jgi:hypothetical protein
MKPNDEQKAIDHCLLIGQQMSNICYNSKYYDQLSDDYRRSAAECLHDWDEAMTDLQQIRNIKKSQRRKTAKGQKVGRRTLSKFSVIHHKDGNPLNNALGNLAVL